MIERIFDEVNLSSLPEHGIKAQKIRAIWLAYGGKWDFCRFFRQGKTFIAAIDGSIVICDDEDTDFEELSDFLNVSGFTDIFCSCRTADSIQGYIKADFHNAVIMTYASPRINSPAPHKTTPGEIWDIIEKCFKPEYEPWYLDMSHRVRHGITSCFRNEYSALVVQHDINGEALISQVCTYPDMERKGYASALIKSVCNSMDSKIQVICEKNLCSFYEKCGFVRDGIICTATSSA